MQRGNVVVGLSDCIPPQKVQLQANAGSSLPVNNTMALKDKECIQSVSKACFEIVMWTALRMLKLIS
jgi:hypothetical protein